MGDIYLVEHYNNDLGTFRNIESKAIKQFFQEKGFDPAIITWPLKGRGIGTGEYDIAETKQNLDLSQLKKPPVILNTHGVFHGRTYFFVDAIKDKFSVLYFDGHPDGCYADESEVNCTNVANKLIELENVSDVCLMGVSPRDIHDCIGYYVGDEESGCFNEFVMPLMYSNKTKIFLGESIDQLKERIEEMASSYPLDIDEEREIVKRIERFKNKYQLFNDFLPDMLNEDKVYISIDMDVIKGFPSGWPRTGRLSLQNILDTIDLVGKEKQVIGADICGLELKSRIGKEWSKTDIKKGLESILEVYLALDRVMGN